MTAINAEFWQGKSVLITGHTGFKGAWLTLVLVKLGASITGYSLPAVSGSLYEAIEKDIEGSLRCQVFEDIRDRESLRKTVCDAQPDVIIHMAAQPLVSEGYKDPVATWEINVMGTIYLLDSLVQLSDSCVCLVVTTDKVYRNTEDLYGLRETDPLGGYDPYSASKSAADIAALSWAQSYYRDTNQRSLSIRCARAGNVIGGGDYAPSRLIPDIVSSIRSNTNLQLRSPTSVRPWQHVLDVISGYLILVQECASGRSKSGGRVLSPGSGLAYNFGPMSPSLTAYELAELFLKEYGAEIDIIRSPSDYHESTYLRLSSELAFAHLGWSTLLGCREAVQLTSSWYRRVDLNGKDPFTACMEDVEYFLLLKETCFSRVK